MTPSWKDRLRPLELIVMSAVLAVFTGLIVALSTRQILLGAIFTGVAFIVALVALAMLALSAEPDDAEKLDLDEQDHPAH